MDAVIRKQWVDALISGEYEQVTDGYLRQGDKFCALGVLADVLDLGWEVTGHMHNYAEVYKVLTPVPVNMGNGEVSFYFASSTLPDPVRAEIGLDAGFQSTITQFNDGFKWDFDSIADWIDENL